MTDDLWNEFAKLQEEFAKDFGYYTSPQKMALVYAAQVRDLKRDVRALESMIRHTEEREQKEKQEILARANRLEHENITLRVKNKFLREKCGFYTNEP